MVHELTLYSVAALKQMQNLGVEILYRRDDEKPVEKEEEILFDGFVVTEENTTDQEEFDAAQVRRPVRALRVHSVCFASSRTSLILTRMCVPIEIEFG